MKVERGKLYQDPIYGTVVLSPLATAIIDTPEFQRLAGVRQLGFADMVFRGARHSRFEHSIGCYALARDLIQRIAENHERMGLEHPAAQISATFGQGAGAVESLDRRWAGLADVIGAAALLHDIGHVPFGHTLEDEFPGLYERHDRLAGPRLYHLLFHPESELATLFTSPTESWVGAIPNDRLQQLIYLILSWTERIAPPVGFAELIAIRLGNTSEEAVAERLRLLARWHEELTGKRFFQPYMSDIVGSTISADLLDYLPRDRHNLGLEARYHERLHRYFTLREGTLYPGEGLRLSIMVTRPGRGGQRQDVATEVLEIMRERYQMTERVYYHHKKAAASAMLGKLLELADESGQLPRDDESPYPAPWSGDPVRDDDASEAPPAPASPHVLHFSDIELLDYLGRAPVRREDIPLRNRLHKALRYRRQWIYRTLLVIDTELARACRDSVAAFARDLRGGDGHPANAGRRRLEFHLARAAEAGEGDVIVYCPPPTMQSKEVDARLEIRNGHVLPLRLQTDAFVYHADMDVMKQYYEELWRAYVYVAPELFADIRRCRALVDAFCQRYSIPAHLAYAKVRTHEFRKSARDEDAGAADLWER